MVNAVCAAYELTTRDAAVKLELEQRVKLLEQRLHSANGLYMSELLPLRNAVRTLHPDVEKGVELATPKDPIATEQMYSLDPIRSFDREVQELIATSVNEKVLSIVQGLGNSNNTVQLMSAEDSGEKKGPSDREMELEALVPQLESKVGNLEASKKNLLAELDAAELKASKFQDEVQGVKQRSEAKITALEEQTKELQSAVETEKEKSKTV